MFSINTETEMAEYKNCVIFFLDILGFKEIIEHNKISVDEMLKKFDNAEYHLDYTRDKL